MFQHLRANVWLLLFTLILCSGAYPLTLWAIAQAPMFRAQAEGSLLSNGKTSIGSKLIAQPFTGDEYFQPRPSAAGYNAAASGASNYAASNYLLRDRVARQLGPIVRYGKDAAMDGKKPGELAGPDIEKWFQKNHFGGKPGLVAQWADLHKKSGLAESWIKDTDNALKPQWRLNDKDRDAGKSFLAQLEDDDPDLHEELLSVLKNHPPATTADLASALFPLLSSQHPGQWLILDGDKSKKLKYVTESSDIQSIFFDMWRQDHPNVSLEEIPGDMVTASASGLDPHITLKNAQYQLKYRIPEARANKMVQEIAKKLHKDFDSPDVKQQVRKDLEKKLGKEIEKRVTEVIEELLKESAHAPLGGLAGVPLVNVLELNLAVDARIKELLAEK